jgi:hypothetical protein
MANSKTKRSWLGWAWRHKTLSLFALVIVAAGAYVGYNHVQTSNNKRNFQQARAAIDSVYDDAIRNVGKPDNAEEKSFCSRSHKEFSSGDLTCEVDTNFIYAVSNEEEANNVMGKIQQSTYTVAGLKKKETAVKKINDFNILNVPYHTASDSYSYNGLNCVIGYVFDTPREMDLKVNDDSKKSFEINMSCSGPAKQQYYRMAS